MKWLQIACGLAKLEGRSTRMGVPADNMIAVHGCRVSNPMVKAHSLERFDWTRPETWTIWMQSVSWFERCPIGLSEWTKKIM